MAWNEPGNKGNNPWGSPSNNGSKKNGDNDLQELLQKLKALLGGSGGVSNSGEVAPVGKLVLLILAVLLISWGALGFYQLDEQKRAVVLRLGAYHGTVSSGWHWNPPFIDTVIKDNVTQLRSYTSQGAMLTSDENIVDVQLSVQYNIKDLEKFTLSIREPELTLADATDSALRHVVGNSGMDELLTIGRAKIAPEVQTRLQHYLDKYQTGIFVAVINVERTQPPKQVQDAFDDVSKAREDEQRFQNEAKTYANTVIPQARGIAKRLNSEALAYRDSTIARAQGEASRFDALLTAYRTSPTVTRQRLYIDAMQDVMTNNSKVLVDVAKGSNMLYLPLDQLRNQPAGNKVGSSAERSDGTSISQIDIDNISKRIEEKLRGEQQKNSNTRRRESRQ